MRRRVARGRGCFLYDVPYVGTPDRILAPCGQSAGRAAAQRVSRREASAFLWFVAGSPWQRAIHGFKYYNRWRTARDLGAWYGGNLADSGLYGSVDCIVPVPLHTRRLLARGYNQAAYIAEGIASRMGVPVEDRAVSRLRNNPSQTTRSSAGRWENVRDLFAVARPGALAGRHVLLVDDVVTTGSTLLSCTEALLRAVPDCRVSIAALAVSRRHFGLDR